MMEFIGTASTLFVVGVAAFVGFVVLADDCLFEDIPVAAFWGGVVSLVVVSILASALVAP